MSEEKKQQVLALGRLGWSLRQIQTATRIRRETASQYLKAAGIAVRPPGAGGGGRQNRPNEVTTYFSAGKPAVAVITDPNCDPKPTAKTKTLPLREKSLHSRPMR